MIEDIGWNLICLQWHEFPSEYHKNLQIGWKAINGGHAGRQTD
jgi:hypothetical protein